MAVERTPFEINGLKAVRYEERHTPPNSDEATIALHGLLCNVSTPGSTVDQIATRWAAVRSPVIAFDASGSFANGNRMVDGQNVPFSFSQYVKDTEEVVDYALYTSPNCPRALTLLGYSLGGTVALEAMRRIFTHTPKLAAKLDTRIALIQTPLRPDHHKNIARYPRFRRVIEARGHTFGAANGGRIVFGKEVLDDYLALHEKKGDTRDIARGVTSHGAKVLYVTSSADSKVNPAPIFDLANDRSYNLEVAEVDNIDHDTTDPSAIDRLTHAVLSWA